MNHYSHIFCFNGTPTTEIYTLSLHDALPILTHVFFCVSKNVSVSCAYTQGKREQFSGFNRTLDAGNTDVRSEERFSRNAETDLVCRLLLEKKKCLIR